MSISKVRLIAIAFVAVFSTLLLHAGEMRRFTDTKGRTLVGKIVAADDSEVSIKLSRNLRTVKVGLANLSEADRTHVQQWVSGQRFRQLTVAAKQVRFGRDVEKRSRTKKKSKKRGVETNLITKRRYTDWGVDVVNRGELSVEGVSLECQLVRQIAGSGLREWKDYQIDKVTKKIGALGSRESRAIEVKSADFPSDKSGNKTVPIKGLLIDLKVGDDVVRSISVPPDLVDEIARAKKSESQTDEIEVERKKRAKSVKELGVPKT